MTKEIQEQRITITKQLKDSGFQGFSRPMAGLRPLHKKNLYPDSETEHRTIIRNLMQGPDAALPCGL
mgnify:CR=1 FL=1